ncbi:hypothetical protein IMG5_070660 [Ichthyophthirius multifiliis]|uniref:Uncharacterized protein n=1 Tax=Ichthyophthirius multifiliis TaxID=5932 RepID=G0QPR9_ICHMU|nr:hypothetical protein IMG5_070660 [Ichthyophthirius multifiliis]EGR32784.1 hypothetical protein IMG5_070660 [Ichthyophthirius multifiliis]|eukprot:XP_004036770.1 hypothetical protein IMG5_070660 [Ichthyophthirius multifiliis]
MHLTGKTTINQIEYETVCDCAEVNNSQILDPDSESCNPNKLKLQIDKQVEGGLQQEEIRDIIGDLHALKFVNPKEYHFMSLDGRNTDPCLSTLGGDAGEFILALFIYEGMLSKRQLDQESVDTFLKSYLQYIKQEKFYFATDDDAIFHLERETGITLNIETLRNPNENDKPELLKALIKAENQGDRHIKNLLKNSDLYSIRPEIIQMFIKAFFGILWNKQNPLKSKLFLDSLIGQPQEQAFLEIKSNEICIDKHLSPLILPRKKINNEWKMAFVNHFDAAEQKRKQLASFFADEINHHQEPINAEIMYNRLRKHGLSFLEVSGSRLAKSLPFYTLDMV